MNLREQAPGTPEEPKLSHKGNFAHPLGTLDPEKETSLDEVLTTLELPPGRLRRRAKAPRAMVLDALQRQPPLHILNARDSVAAEFPKFEHLPRKLTGPAARAS